MVFSQKTWDDRNQNVLHAGRNATLTLDASAGHHHPRVVLDDLLVQGEVKQPNNHLSRNGPSRIRREKRAAARRGSEENAAAEISPEEAELLALADEVELSTKAEEATVVEEVSNNPEVT